MRRRRGGSRVYVAADVDVDIAAALDAEADRRDLTRADIIRDWLRRMRDIAVAEPGTESPARDEGETDAA